MSGGPTMASLNFDMKKKKESYRRQSNVSVMPGIDIAGNNGSEHSDSPRSRRSEVLQQWTDDLGDEHQQELKKKDSKLKKLEEKLKKCQSQLKTALDRVYQLEKVKIDEAAGVIPPRKGV